MSGRVGFSFHAVIKLSVSSLFPVLTTPESTHCEPSSHQTGDGILLPAQPRAVIFASSLSYPLDNLQILFSACLFNLDSGHFSLHKHQPVNPPPLQVQVMGPNSLYPANRTSDFPHSSQNDSSKLNVTCLLPIIQFLALLKAWKQWLCSSLVCS